MSRRKKPRLPAEPRPAVIESLSHDGRGVARLEGKAVFIDGALPGEQVDFIYVGRHRRYDEGRTVAVRDPSPDRVEPRCAHFGVCGGCSLQHLAADAQIRAKQQVLLDNLAHIGKVTPARVLEPLTGPHWGYRHKARLGVKYVRKKGQVMVGFRERHAPYVTDCARCEVLHPAVGERLTELQELVAALAAYDQIAQIEVAVGDATAALVFRNLAVLDGDDRARLAAFGERTGLHIYLQPKGPDTVTLLWPEASELSYGLPAYGVELAFLPTDFTQVNLELNRAMVDRALELLELTPDNRVLDLFCGLGNFTLPLARHAAEVVGVEGEAGLVARAEANARRNDITNTRFYTADLTADLVGSPWLEQTYDRILLDPPRSGAAEVIPLLAGLKAPRIVYVACHPGSLARDAGLLVHAHGYRLAAAGVMDMFPHTAHVESIAVFERH